MQLGLITQVATINVARLPWENTSACGLLAALSVRRKLTRNCGKQIFL